MEPIILIHGYSSESKEATEEEVGKIYGSLPEDLQRIAGQIVPVNVSRYVSLDDLVDVDDVSLALDRALRSRYPDLLKTGFNAIVHSTGALVVRNWVRRFSPKPSPLKRIIHLAGANLGSGWAHIGESLAVKWGRFAFQGGTQRGMAVLDALELGSSWTIDLHRHFLQKGQNMFHDYGVMEFCVIGTQVPPEWMVVPFRYGREDGSDGVVRVSSCNLNFNYLRIGPSQSARAIDWEAAADYARRVSAADRDLFSPGGVAFAGSYYEIKHISMPGYRDRHEDDGGMAVAEHDRELVPLAIPYECAHSTGDKGVVYGSDTRDDVLPLIDLALRCRRDDGSYGRAREEFQATTARTYQTSARGEKNESLFGRLVSAAMRSLYDNPQGQYDGHAQVVLRVRDQNGKPVNDFSVYFNSMGGEGQPNEFINALFEDEHRNNTTPNCLTYYLRTDCWDQGQRTWVSRMPGINGVDLEIDGVDLETLKIRYLPMRMRVSQEQLSAWIQPHRTTILDIELMRLPSDEAFRMF